jgi:copper(I)-binding protein
MSRSKRLMLMPSAAVVVAISLAFGSVAAQDDSETMDPMESMDPMEQMEPGLSVRHAWTRESMMIDLAGAAYMVIHNNSDADDALLGASSPAAGVVEIHESSMDEDGAMAMMHVEEIPIPAHADAVLEPGGFHIMLIDLVEPLTEGTEIELVLEFATAEPQTVMVPVQGMAPMGDMDMDDMDGDHDDMDDDDDMGMDSDDMDDDDDMDGDDD